jgi:hypothetical protein
MSPDDNATGCIVSDADGLLTLFDADFGMLVIGDGVKILGPNEYGQEILLMAEYLRLKEFKGVFASFFFDIRLIFLSGRYKPLKPSPKTIQTFN